MLTSRTEASPALSKGGEARRARENPPKHVDEDLLPYMHAVPRRAVRRGLITPLQGWYWLLKENANYPNSEYFVPNILLPNSYIAQSP